MDLKQLFSLFPERRGEKVGLLSGLILGVVFLFFGFWRMVFFALIVLGSFLVGSRLEGREDVRRLFDQLSFDRFKRK